MKKNLFTILSAAFCSCCVLTALHAGQTVPAKKSQTNFAAYFDETIVGMDGKQNAASTPSLTPAQTALADAFAKGVDTGTMKTNKPAAATTATAKPEIVEAVVLAEDQEAPQAVAPSKKTVTQTAQDLAAIAAAKAKALKEQGTKAVADQVEATKTLVSHTREELEKKAKELKAAAEQKAHEGIDDLSKSAGQAIEDAAEKVKIVVETKIKSAMQSAADWVAKTATRFSNWVSGWFS